MDPQQKIETFYLDDSGLKLKLEELLSEGYFINQVIPLEYEGYNWSSVSKVRRALSKVMVIYSR